MTNGIKVGDIVRVSEDAPKVYTYGWSTSFKHNDSKVLAVEDGNAVIESGRFEKTIPTKYLVKVNAEPKSKYKVGDRVKFKSLDELCKVKDYSFYWQLSEFANKEATITAVEDNGFYRVDIDPSIGGINDDMIECKVESTEADKKPSVGSITIPVKADLTDSYWDAYAADLAKELALKVANKFNDPKEAAEYAVSVAKAVVEELKRK